MTSFVPGRSMGLLLYQGGICDLLHTSLLVCLARPANITHGVKKDLFVILYRFGTATSKDNENVYIVYLLSPLTTTDFHISDGILKVVNAIIVLIIIMKDKPLVRFSVGVHIE